LYLQDKTLEGLRAEFAKAKGEAEAYLQVARYIVGRDTRVDDTRPLGQGSLLQT
jgi:hypothetical protein